MAGTEVSVMKELKGILARSCRMKRQKGTGLSRRTLILCEDSLKLLTNGYSTRSVFSMELS